MATGRIQVLLGSIRIRHSSLTFLLCLLPGLAFSADVGLAGVISGKALLTVDGSAPEVVAVGQSIGGVKLVSVQGDQAIVEVDGKKRNLRIGQFAASGSAGGDGGKVVLTADGAGHFVSTGTINGVSVRFLVDTGATMVSLGASDAKRIGIDASKGERGTSQTANGQVQVVKVKLDSVRIGEVTLLNVDALVHSNDMPIALLGMSFLNRMEMQREGSTMTLKKRF